MNNINTLSAENINSFMEFMAFFEHAKVLKEQELIVNRFTAPNFSEPSSIRKRLSQCLLMRIRNEIAKDTFEIGSDVVDSSLNLSMNIESIDRKRTRNSSLVDYFEFNVKSNNEINFSNFLVSKNRDFFGKNIKIIKDRSMKNAFINGMFYHLQEENRNILMNDYELIAIKSDAISTHAQYNHLNRLVEAANNYRLQQLRNNGLFSFSPTGVTSDSVKTLKVNKDNLRLSYYKNVNPFLVVAKYFYNANIDYDHMFNDDTSDGMYCNTAYKGQHVDGSVDNYYMCFSNAIDLSWFYDKNSVRDIYNRRSSAEFVRKQINWMESNSSVKSALEHQITQDNKLYMFILSKKCKNEDNQDVCHPFTVKNKVTHSLKLSEDSILSGEALTNNLNSIKQAILSQQVRIVGL